MSAFRLVEFYVTDITGNVAIPVPKCFVDPVIDLCYLISPLFCGDLILCCRHVRGVKEPVLRARANMSTNQLPMPYFKTRHGKPIGGHVCTCSENQLLNPADMSVAKN